MNKAGFIKKITSTDLCVKYLIASTLLLTVLSLWPFDFCFDGARWCETLNGIEFQQKGQVVSLSSANGLYKHIMNGEGLSLEVLLKAQNDVQTGPARIVSYSSNTGNRNFTLGQSKKKLVMRLRTTKTNFNGTNPQLVVDNAIDSSKPQHIIITYDFSEQCVYVNGKKRGCKHLPGGNFDNWDPSYFLLIGNEATGDRPWLGGIFFIAIYNRPLNELEVQENYLAGWLSKSKIEVANPPVSRGLVSCYYFDEKAGRKIYDRSMTDSPLNLYMPKMIRNYDKSYLDLSGLSFSIDLMQFWQAILHVLVFIPMGFFFHAAMRNRFGTSLRISALVFITLALFGFSIESLQHLSLTRHSSSLDLFCHMLGIVLGITTDKSLTIYLKSRDRSF